MWDTYKNTNNYIFQFKIFTCYKLLYIKLFLISFLFINCKLTLNSTFGELIKRLCCIVLYCTTLHYAALQRTVLFVLYFTLMYCSALLCIITIL